MRILYFSSSLGTDTITNLAAAETEVANQSRMVANLTGYTEARFSVYVSTVGFAGSTIYPKYSTDGGTVWNEFDTGLRASLTTGGLIVTSWVTVPTGARTDVLLSLFTKDGNGAADPVIRGMGLELRTTSYYRTVPWHDPLAQDTYSNAPAAETLWPSTGARQADLTGYTHARFSFTCVTAGSAGTTLMPKYSTDGGSSWNTLDGGTGLQLAWDALGRVTSSVVALESGAKADVLLGLFEAGGNATADPQARGVILELTAPILTSAYWGIQEGS